MTLDIQPFFLPSAAGRIFCVYFPPQGGIDSGRDVLFFPPFAEELNKSRRMIALQARTLARRGIGVLVPDLYGTGDSDGDFGDARWELWRQDMAAACGWLRSRGSREIVFWGQRMGALLAAAAAGEEKPVKIVLWQPVVRGALYLTQFLRLRLAADMMTGGESSTTDDLRRDLKAGSPVEIAGYRLHPELAAAIDTLDLGDLTLPPDTPVAWLELVAAPERPLAHVSRQLVERWRGGGRAVEAIAVCGEPFWSTPEITEVPELIEVTVQQVLA
jgi:exosortase A-associated hydrolase 2